jgi:sphingomyelin phosphodiesterase acid-like 3
VLTQFSDVVALTIFAHTHMDEVRILQPEDASRAAASSKGVAAKLVSSISPINGNAPSFTVAQVDPASAALEDFQVFAASNATGIQMTWNEEYDWRKTYHESEFSAAGVSKEIAGFGADKDAKTDESRSYIGDFFVGSSQLLAFIWPQYVCSLSSDSAQAFKACVCPAEK